MINSLTQCPICNKVLVCAKFGLSCRDILCEAKDHSYTVFIASSYTQIVFLI